MRAIKSIRIKRRKTMSKITEDTKSETFSSILFLTEEAPLELRLNLGAVRVLLT